ELALTYSFWPWRFLGLLWPNLFGSPVTGDYWGYATYWEDALYIGLLPFFLALSTLRWVRRRGPTPWATSAVRWAWATWALIALLALGKHTPVYPWLYAHVPTFDWFQAPARWHLIGTVLLALLAGLGAEGWRPPSPRAAYWLRLGIAAAAGVTVMAKLATPLAGDRASIARAVAWSGVWAMGAGVLALRQPAPRTRSRALWAGAVLAWVALDLGLTHAGWTPTIEAAWYRAQNVQPSGRVFFPAQDEYDFKFKDYFRLKDLRPARPWSDLRLLGLPNLRLLDGARTLNNFDPMRPGSFERLLTALDQAPPGARERVLDRLAVVAEIRRVPSAPGGFRVVPRQPQGLVQWYPKADVVTDEAAAWQALWHRASLGGPAWDERITVLAEPFSGPSYPAPTELPNPAASEHVALTWDMPTPTYLRIHVQTPGAGWLLVAQQAYPGWQAQIDGRATPLYRAEYALLALPLTAGEHIVTLTYHAPGWPLTAALALLTLGATTAVLLGSRVREDE
ncbi:MAG: YfhO family protein, partial [Chloroflexi bacterium]|nr:YfhO family protein [Chloroflexota bacterium]